VRTPPSPGKGQPRSIITTTSAICAPPRRLPLFRFLIPTHLSPQLLISILYFVGDLHSTGEPHERGRVRLAPALHEDLVVRHQAPRPMTGAGALWGSFLYVPGDLNRLEELAEACCPGGGPADGRGRSGGRAASGVL